MRFSIKVSFLVKIFSCGAIIDKKKLIDYCLLIKNVACDAISGQNFRLRHYFGQNLLPAALFSSNIFACGAILHEKLRLKCNIAPKFSHIIQYVANLSLP
ncbi:MAG: hypothetical protein GY738_09335 [Pseudoalteromonas sp.]|nr:hypothetical protein [Pseudoalteromonas sp.]